MSSELVISLRESLKAPANEQMYDALAEYLELGIDSLLNEGLLRDVPFVGTVRAFCKTGANIRERNLLRQTASFIKSLNEGSLSTEDIEAYQRRLEKDQKAAERELGRVILILDRTIEEKQSRVLGRLCAAYVSGKTSWDEFVELSEVNSRMFVADYVLLHHLKSDDALESERHSEFRLVGIQRLESLGLVAETGPVVHDGNLELRSGDDRRFRLTQLGLTFCNFIVE